MEEDPHLPPAEKVAEYAADLADTPPEVLRWHADTPPTTPEKAALRAAAQNALYKYLLRKRGVDT